MVLTGLPGMVCPGDSLMYTCERTGVTVNTIIAWDFISNENNLLGGATFVRTLNESTSIQLREGFTLTGNISSSGTVIAVLQVNASSDYNGAMVICYINGPSNTIVVSIRGECVTFSASYNELLVLPHIIRRPYPSCHLFTGGYQPVRLYGNSTILDVNSSH